VCEDLHNNNKKLHPEVIETATLFSTLYVANPKRHPNLTK